MKNKDFIITYTKKMFSPLNAKPDEIDITDIAHALSLMCRANGHIKHFYSVAQHSINCLLEAKSREFSKKVQLACLLHDASEAYISDITRPVKRHLPQYVEIEEVLQNRIFSSFGIDDLSEEECRQIKDVDDSLLYYELLELMGEKIFDHVPRMGSRPDFEQRDFMAVRDRFISEYTNLSLK